MGDNSAIEWTEATWNPIRGCSRVSEGCRNCYAERDAIRHVFLPTRPLGGVEKGKEPGPYHGLVKSTPSGPRWTGEIRFIEKALELPLRWKAPRRIFVNSMSDLFHEKVADEWIWQIYGVMSAASQHTFQVLTKRPERMRRIVAEITGAKAPCPNVWLGVSVEDQATADARIPLLLQTPAAVRWVSYEPALGLVDFSPWVFNRAAIIRKAMNGPMVLNRDQADSITEYPLDWIVVGGESGPGARPFDLAWARSTIAQCRAAGMPVFVKQLGADPISSKPEFPRLRDRKGGDPAEWPEDLRVREYPPAAVRA